MYVLIISYGTTLICKDNFNKIFNSECHSHLPTDGFGCDLFSKKANANCNLNFKFNINLFLERN